MTVLRMLWPYAAAAASGAMLAACYAPWNVEGLAWVWMAPLLWALWFGLPEDGPSAGQRARRGALLAYTAGAVFFLINLSWLHTVSSLGAILIALYLACYFAAWGAFAATVARPLGRGLVPAAVAQADDPRSAMRLGMPAPGRGFPMIAGSLHNLKFAFLNGAAWCGCEWLRGVLFTGFGWNGLGVALHENLMLIQIADVIGVTGLSFILMFCGCIAVGTVRRIHLEFGKRAVRPHIDFAVTIIMVLSVFFYGLRQTNRGYDDMIPVTTLIVQLNIPVDEKWQPENAANVYRLYDEFTSLFTEFTEFDLVLWPETALYHEFFHRETEDYLNHVLAQDDFHLILGIEEGDIPDDFYNSIALLRNNWRNHQLHRKIHLVPFGEYIPLRHAFPPFEWVAGGQVPSDFSRGDSFAPLEMEDPEIEIIPLICFEDTLGRLVRRFVTPRAQLIVNVTNDGWFLESPAAEQHLANAKFRCVELKRPMARAANTGVSGIIDHVGSLFDRRKPSPRREDSGARGRIIHDHETGSPFVRGCLKDVIHVPRNPPVTFYARRGDLFSQVMLGLAAAAAVLRSLRARRSSP